MAATGSSILLMARSEKRVGDDGAERQKQHTILIEAEPEQRNDAGQAHIIAAHGLQEQKPQHGGGKDRGMVTERAGDERRGEHEQQYRPEAQQRAHQQPQPRAGRRRVECIRGLRRGKGVLRLLLRAFFPGLFFLEALELAAALFRLPLFPALGAGKLSGLLGVRGRTLRVGLAAVGPDGGTLRLGVKRMVSPPAGGSAGFSSPFASAAGTARRTVSSVTGSAGAGASRFVQPPNSFMISSSE